MNYSLPILLALAATALLSPAGAAIPQSGLVACYPFTGNADDIEGGHDATLHNGPYLTSNRHGNGSKAYSFGGTGAYMEVPDHADFSIVTTGALSVSVWIRPGTKTFPDTEGSGYVYFMGKGQPSNHEWALRMYSLDNTEGRENRTSCYIWDLSGGLGNGCYVQDPITTGVWMHFVVVYDLDDNTVKWYKNGVLRQTKPIDGPPYPIQNPGNGNAPLRFGTRNNASYFKGAIDDICIYNRALTPSEVTTLYQDTTL